MLRGNKAPPTIPLAVNEKGRGFHKAAPRITTTDVTQTPNIKVAEFKVYSEALVIEVINNDVLFF